MQPNETQPVPTTQTSALTEAEQKAPKLPAISQESVKVFEFFAFHLTESLKLKEIQKVFDLKPLIFQPHRLVYELSKEAYCFLYNFGGVVFFNVSSEARQSTLDRIQRAIGQSSPPLTSDEFALEENKKEGNRVFFEKMTVSRLTREKVELMALILAKSAALETSEVKIERILEQLGGLKKKNVIKFIREVMATKQNLIGTLALLEKPDETWDSKTLDDLYQEAVTMFELNGRFRTLDYKLKMIQENLELLANFASNRQHLLLEVTIVALIVVEVVLVLYQLWG